MGTYVVKAGDTVQSIAAQFDLSISALLTLNPDADPDELTLGEILTIPDANPASGEAPAQRRYARVHVQGDDGLNLRTRPHVSSHTRIATAHAGAVFELLDDTAAWWRLALFRSEAFAAGLVEVYAHSFYLRHYDPEDAPPLLEDPEAGATADLIDIPEEGLTAYTRRQMNGSTEVGALRGGEQFEVLQQHQHWVQIVIQRHPHFVDGHVLAWVRLEEALDLDTDGSDMAVIDISGTLPRHATERYATRNVDDLIAHVVHHSASPNTITPESVANWHVAGRDWPGIGYTFFVAADGSIFQCHPLNTRAWAVRGHNDIYLSTCLVGNFTQGRTPTMAQLCSLRWLHLTWIPQQLGRQLPLLGHKEGEDQATSCPGTSWDWHAVVV